MDQDKDPEIPFMTALVSGAVAGLCVDMTLFPLDTIKTRLQSPKGFFGAGGYRGIYSGVASAAIGSMPTAAVFFCTYELFKSEIRTRVPEGEVPALCALGASLGEVAACTIRVPVEVVKQRAQASGRSSRSVFLHTLRTDGPPGFYRGFITTVLREIPFSFIQFPIWEMLKSYLARRYPAPAGATVSAWHGATCGCVSGAIAAAITNPLDVAKTRIMLAKSGTPLARGGMWNALSTVVQEKGLRGLTAGMLPRTMWMSLGGFIFLGTYDLVKMSMIGDAL